MPTERFDVIFSGQIIDGHDKFTVRSQVGRLFNVTSDAQIEPLFSGRPVVIKKSLDLETANRYRLAFLRAGALIEIRPSAFLETNQPVESAPAAPVATDWTVLPPNTGTLEDCATPPQTQPIPDIKHLTMATPGVRLDQTPPTPAVSIDTGKLDLLPGQNWTLEDCQIPLKPVALPNIQTIALLAPGTILDETPAPAPARIDTGGLNVVAEQNWSLQDCQPPPPPALRVDLSGLKLVE